MEMLEQELRAAHRVLLECEQRKTMVAAREVATMLHQMGSSHGQDFVATVYAFLQSIGLPPGWSTLVGTPGVL